jgi:hypothetical protein
MLFQQFAPNRPTLIRCNGRRSSLCRSVNQRLPLSVGHRTSLAATVFIRKSTVSRSRKRIIHVVAMTATEVVVEVHMITAKTPMIVGE